MYFFIQSSSIIIITLSSTHVFRSHSLIQISYKSRHKYSSLSYSVVHTNQCVSLSRARLQQTKYTRSLGFRSIIISFLKPTRPNLLHNITPYIHRFVTCTPYSLIMGPYCSRTRPRAPAFRSLARSLSQHNGLCLVCVFNDK